MQNHLARCLLLAISIAGVACSDPDNAPQTPNMGGSGGTAGSAGSAGAGGSVAGGTGGSGGSGGTAPACNDLVLDAPSFEATYDAAAAPEAMGGNIADGTYFITEQIFYEIASGPSISLGRTKVEVSGSTWEEVTSFGEAGGIEPDQHRSYDLSASGTTLSLERTCPTAGAPESGEYTATADAFTLYVVDVGMTVGTVFTKQ